MRVWNRHGLPLWRGLDVLSVAAREAQSGAIRLAVTAISLPILMLFVLLHGQLPWLGNFEWLAGVHPEIGRAWLAPLGNRSLDEDRRTFETNLLDWAPGNPADAGARLCRLAGPAFAQRPDSLCAPYWHQLGPPHQPHDTIRNQGSGFSVWHGAVYFAMPTDTDPPPPERHLALWVGLCLHKLWLGLRPRRAWDGWIWGAIALAVTQLWVLLAWIFFRCPGFADLASLPLIQKAFIYFQF